MKKCTYCGKEYPDTATACAIDGEALTSGSGAVGGPEQRKKVTGIWRGMYGHVEVAGKPKRPLIPFTLKLKQGWFAHFTGTMTEDAPPGLPGTCTVDGSLDSPEVKFTLQLPVRYLGPPDRQITLREYIISKGYECTSDLPAPSIMFKGTFLDANRMQGTWLSEARRFSLPNKKTFKTAATAGHWCAAFIAADLNINPAGGPTEPFFDQALLPMNEQREPEPNDVVPEGLTLFPPAELNPPEAVPEGCVCLARLEPLEAKHLLKRLEEEAIPVQIDTGEQNYETARGRQKNYYIEIFVPEAEFEKARKIRETDWKV